MLAVILFKIDRLTKFFEIWNAKIQDKLPYITARFFLFVVNQNLTTKTRIRCGPLRILRDWQPGIDTTKTKKHTEGLLIPVRIEYVVLSGDVWISVLEEEYLVVSISISASLRSFLLPFAIHRQLSMLLVFHKGSRTFCSDYIEEVYILYDEPVFIQSSDYRKRDFLYVGDRGGR